MVTGVQTCALPILLRSATRARARPPSTSSSQAGTSGSYRPERSYWYLPNSDLKPEISKEYEAGFSYVAEGLFGTDLNLFAKAMYFEGRIEDMISFETLPERGMSPDNSPYGTYKNIDRAKQHLPSPAGGMGI